MRSYQDYPCRDDYVKPIAITDNMLFHPMDVVELRQKKVYDRFLRKFAVLVTGVLENGAYAEVIVDNLDIYFDILIESKAAKLVIDELIKDKYTISDIVPRYKGVNFQAQPSMYLRVYFDNMFNRDKALEIIVNNQYETATDVKKSQWLQHILLEHELTVSDWVTLKKFRYTNWENNKHVFFASVDNYIPVNRPMSEDKPRREVTQKPRYFILAWDIEVMAEGTRFPSVENIKEDIFMIGGGIYVSDRTPEEGPLHQFCITFKDLEYTGTEDWDYIKVKDEKELILAFAEIVGKFKPEFRLAFNNYGFDNPYVFIRAAQSHMNIFDTIVEKMAPVPIDYYRPSKKMSVYDTVIKKERIKMEGAFDSNSEKYVVHWPGAVDLDIMICLKRMTYKKEETLAGHALRAYLERYNLPSKLDISVADMQRAYRENNKKLMKEVADYCVVDGLSCQRLQEKVGIVMALMSLAHLSYTTIYNCAVRAGGMKVKNVIYAMGFRNDIVYTERVETPPKFKYPGALVFNPVKGRNIDVPIMALDYKSLYPSIMRAMNMSSETYLKDDKEVEPLRAKGYDVYEFTYPLEGSDVTVHFVRTGPDGEKLRGVYCQVLVILAKLRNFYKKGMKEATDPITAKMYDEKQKATKILMNTLYGSVGCTMFCLYNVYISSAITMFGRRALTVAKEVAEGMDTKLIYGDSVTGETPIIIKRDGKIEVIRIDQLVDRYYPSRDKEFCDLEETSVSVWSHEGWTKVKRVIRHRVNKRLFRVRTKTSFVDVTEDHSLLDDKNEIIKPTEIGLETRLLETELPDIGDDLNLDDCCNDQRSLLVKWLKSPYKHKVVSNDYSSIINHEREVYDSGRVYSVTELPRQDGFVYDLSTTNERFHAGVGKLVVHNTDSVFVKPQAKHFPKDMSPAEKVAKAVEMARPIQKAINDEMRRITGDQFATIEMELDKFLFPSTYLGKKKYLGRIWDGNEDELYISGLEVLKRGKSELLRDTSYEVIEQLNDLSYHGTIVDCVVGVLSKAVDDILEKPREYFYRKAKYTEGKTGSVAMFINRMKEKTKENPAVYYVPDPGVYFEIAVCKVIDHLNYDGTKRASKVSDKWELKEVIEHYDLPIDRRHYLDDILGTLARFINSDDQFEPNAANELTAEEIDKKSQILAERFLEEKLDELTGGTGYLHLTKVKRQRKILNGRYKKLGAYLEVMTDAYNNNISKGMVEYILQKCESCNYSIANVSDSVTRVEIESQVNDLRQYLIDRTYRIDGMYKKYRDHLEYVSKNPINILEFDEEINERSIKKFEHIHNKINELRQKYSILNKLPEDGEVIDIITLALDKVFSVV